MKPRTLFNATIVLCVIILFNSCGNISTNILYKNPTTETYIENNNVRSVPYLIFVESNDKITIYNGSNDDWCELFFNAIKGVACNNSYINNDILITEPYKAYEIIKQLILKRNEFEYMVVELGYDGHLFLSDGVGWKMAADGSTFALMHYDDHWFAPINDARFPDINNLQHFRERATRVFSEYFAAFNNWWLLHPEMPHLIEYDGTLYRMAFVQLRSFIPWVIESAEIINIQPNKIVAYVHSLRYNRIYNSYDVHKHIVYVVKSSDGWSINNIKYICDNNFC